VAATTNVATVDDADHWSLQKTISDVEHRLDSAGQFDNNDDDDNDDDVMPAVANEMGVGVYLLTNSECSSTLSKAASNMLKGKWDPHLVQCSLGPQEPLLQTGP